MDITTFGKSEAAKTLANLVDNNKKSRKYITNFLIDTRKTFDVIHRKNEVCKLYLHDRKEIIKNNQFLSREIKNFLTNVLVSIYRNSLKNNLNA